MDGSVKNLEEMNPRDPGDSGVPGDPRVPYATSDPVDPSDSPDPRDTYEIKPPNRMRGCEQKFGQNLLKVLNMNDPVVKEIIEWSPCGRKFIVTNKRRLMDEVYPHYLSPNPRKRSTNWYTWTRQCNLYNIKRVKDTDSLTYFNENIRRDQPDRIVNMHRKRQKSRKKKENTNIDTFPPSSAIPEDSS